MTRTLARFIAFAFALCALFSAPPIGAQKAGSPVLGKDALAAFGAMKPSLAIRSRLGEGRWSSKRAIATSNGKELSLSVSAKEGASIRWYLVLPDLTRNYANAAPPWETNAYAWTGMDAIGVFQIELAAFRNRAEIRPFDGDAVASAIAALKDSVAASGGNLEGFEFYHAELGTFWFAADVEIDGRASRTRGAVDVSDRGLSSEVFRAVVRGGETYLDALRGFYNVAGLFGSTTWQASHHVGADCADILMAALAEWQRRPLARNMNVQQLTQILKVVATIDVTNGEPSRTLRFGEEIEEGDFVAVKYEGFRKFVHVGAIAADADGDGVLSPNDLVLHAGPYPLHPTRLVYGAFDGEVKILRPRR